MHKYAKSVFLFIIISFSATIVLSQVSKKESQYIIGNDQLKIQVIPSTFSLFITPKGNEGNYISFGSKEFDIKDVKLHDKGMSWKIPSKGIAVTLKIINNYLDVSIASVKNIEFHWPDISGRGYQAYTIPLHQGKYIPVNDPKWIEYLTSREFSGAQDLSMQFFGVNYSNYALVYVIKNMFNNEIKFKKDAAGDLSLDFYHTFPVTEKDKNYGFKVYLSKNTPTAIAKTYKKHVEEQGKYVTLDKKSQKNSNIKKLYGAPHIYLWSSEFFISNNITNFKQLKTKFINEIAASKYNPSKHLMSLFNKPKVESGKEFSKAFDEFRNSKYASKYHNRLFTRAVNEVMLRKDFYNSKAWSEITLTKFASDLLNKGVKELNSSELYQLNKELLWLAYREYMEPVSEWGNGTSTYLLKELQLAGIKKGWLGVNDWVPAEIHPDFVKNANDLGYLIAPYDSYHSIHKPGKEGWITAIFKDTTLFYNSTISKQDGTKKMGFNRVGRKLNPILSLSSVKERVGSIMDEGLKINSWFIDVDATGEFHDDHTPERMTTQKMDMNARLERMSWIRDYYNMVIGSEVGNDFSSTTIAFAHGMTTPVIAWSDPDLRKNKESKYYVGTYYSINGGVPSRYNKQVPMKEKYRYIHFDNRFNIPLFQLVYNNSVITSHHWEWGTLKVPTEIKNQNIKEILYNVPPLYHLDISSWKKHKESITTHYNVFSKVHEKAIKMEMVNFDWLDNSHFVQQTTFGNNDIKITANFGFEAFKYKSTEIQSKTLLIEFLDEKENIKYAPIE